MPRPVGFLVHGSADGHELVASAAQYLPGARDGWDWYVDDLLGSLSGSADRAQALRPAALMGELVGRLHTAFATAWADCRQPVGRAGHQDAERWLRRALDTVAEAEEVTSGAAGERFRSRSAAAGAVVRAGLSAAPGTPMTRVHGDLHVGQVLRWTGGYAVSDFDGNPVLPAAERDLPQPPARDVAGMLRALDHVGRIVDRRTEHAYDGRVRDWAATARRMFLSGYRAALARAGLENIFDPRLLAAFEVEQECRELVYAARHLPRWTYVPDAALAELLPLPGGAHG
jgi:maltokinase